MTRKFLDEISPLLKVVLVRVRSTYQVNIKKYSYLCTRSQTTKVWLRAFFVYRNPVPFLKQKFGEYLAVQPFNIKKNRERKLFCKWVKDFIQPVMEDKDSSPIPRLRWCVCRTKMSTELTESKVERCSVFSYSVLRSCYFVATDST